MDHILRTLTSFYLTHFESFMSDGCVARSGLKDQARAVDANVLSITNLQEIPVFATIVIINSLLHIFT